MANVQDDRPRLPYGARERRSVGLLVLLFLAVFAAIFFIRNVASRHHESAADGAGREHARPRPRRRLRWSRPPRPRPPSLRPRTTEPALSARKQSEIARAIEDGRPALTACYQRALVRDETLVNGNLKVRLSVAASGRVDTVNVSGPPSFHALDPCLKTAVSKWTFPTAPAPYQAEFPLELRGAQ